MKSPDKRICTDYKSFVCAVCVQRGKAMCCLSRPEYEKRYTNWKKRMHVKADEVRELDLQIAALQTQRRAVLEKLSGKDYDRVMLYLKMKV